jgi:PAS domain-containing protein
MDNIKDIIKQSDYNRTIFDATPLQLFIVDDDVRILDCNAMACKALGGDKSLIYRRRGGEVLHCIHATYVPEGCGRGEFCKDCLIRQSVAAAFQGRKIDRKKARMELVDQSEVKEIQLLLTTSPFEYGGQTYALLILEDVTELLTLRGLLPICAQCKKIRDDRQYWQTVEHFFESQLPVNFTHGLCPDCAKKFFAEAP